jgi:hypothetical protein
MADRSMLRRSKRVTVPKDGVLGLAGPEGTRDEGKEGNSLGVFLYLRSLSFVPERIG